MSGVRPFSGNSKSYGNRNPDPSKMRVMQTFEFDGDVLLIHAVYTEAENYEGNKLILIDGMTRDNAEMLRTFDPHFLEDNNVIARFEPTSKGLRHAVRFVIDVMGRTPLFSVDKLFKHQG